MVCSLMDMGFSEAITELGGPGRLQPFDASRPMNLVHPTPLRPIEQATIQRPRDSQYLGM